MNAINGYMFCDISDIDLPEFQALLRAAEESVRRQREQINFVAERERMPIPDKILSPPAPQRPMHKATKKKRNKS